ncbi:MAG: OmpA family protein [Azonexus sp.]|nr:OmpA family protein [Azonexus sp.]MCK6412682.1 OmpA family protein [Azonexus sp.]
MKHASKRAPGCVFLSIPLFLLLQLAGCANTPLALTGRQEARSAPAAVDVRRVLPEPPTMTESPLPILADEDNIFFAFGEARIEPDELPKLSVHAARLKADPKLAVILIGHTDDLGSPAYNLAIAQQRVDAVFEVLRGQGVGRNQLRRYPVGSEKAPAGCRQEACRIKLRRVELAYGR